jgi:hypothetical protein
VSREGPIAADFIINSNLKHIRATNSHLKIVKSTGNTPLNIPVKAIKKKSAQSIEKDRDSSPPEIVKIKSESKKSESKNEAKIEV